MAGVCVGLIAIPIAGLPGPLGVPFFVIFGLPLFMRASPRFHNWILTNRWCGESMSNWYHHKSISHKTKSKIFLSMAVGLIFCGIAPVVSQKLFLGSVISAIIIAIMASIIKRISLPPQPELTPELEA